ncbi:MAG: VWA domain-containing protein [Deltaproteobacteria bacterium]|nr:VWA domain-containing protein [Deltaproteobacteria bacterium]
MSVTRLVCAGLALGAVAQISARPAAAQVAVADRLEAMMIASDRSPGAFPMQEERLAVAIDGQHATSTLTQVYVNKSGAAIEGRYRLRPGSGSVVEGFAYWNGEEKILGEVFERQTARQVYDRVTARGRDPGILEEDGDGAFAFKVFPIAPNERKRVELRWTKWLDRRASVVRYEAPLTRPDAEVVISVTGAVKNLRSPTHKLHVESAAGGVRLRSDGARGTGGGTLTLEWDVDEPGWTPSAYVHAGTGQTDGWFALSLAAPDAPASAVAAKDVTIVIDRSGSMTGDPLKHAKAAAADMIRRLPATDRVNVVSFSDEVDPLFKLPQTLDADTRARAISFVDRLHEGGGTDIALALGTAISGQDPKSERPRVVVFMTDGQSEVDKAIKAANTDTRDVRLFTVGIGNDVNRPLLQRLAAVKRGRFVGIQTTDAIVPEMARLAASIAKPLLVGVSVDVEGAQAVRLYPRTLPDLFAEDELLVTGRLRGTGTARFVIKGRLAGKDVAYTRTVDLARAPARPWVGRLWAQSRVAHLLEELSLGASAPEMKTEVIELALAYNFVTPYTAFLAIPESELGAMRGTVEAARAHKAKVLAAHEDAAALGKAKPSHAHHAKKKADADADGADDADLAESKPRKKSHRRPASAQDDEDDGDRHHGNARTASLDRAPMPTADMSASRGRHGCAGCTTSGGGATAALGVAFALVGLLRRRRRS